MRQAIHFIIMYLLAPLLVLAMIASGLITSGIGSAPSVLITLSANGPLFLFVISQALRGYRRQMDVAALGHIEQAVRLNLPLVKMLEAGRLTESGMLRSRLDGVCHELYLGTPIAQAVGRQLRTISQRSVSQIEAAEQAGCLAPQLRRLMQEEQQTCRERAAREPMTIVYPFIVLSTLACTLGYTAIFLAPKFAKIFEDFDITLPQLTLDVLMVGEYVGAPAMFLGGLIIALVFICSLWQLANEPMRRNLAMELALRAAWWLPVIHSQQKNRGLAEVFHTLADALEAGHPMDRALENAQCLVINPVLQDRVALWRRRVESGVSLDVAARQAGLPAVAVSMLHSSQAAGNLPEACRFLARYFRGKFSRVSALIRGGLVPGIVIFLAVIVGLVVYSLFLPLVSLIEATVAASM